jgi:hypothetical protein
VGETRGREARSEEKTFMHFWAGKLSQNFTPCIVRVSEGVTVTRPIQAAVTSQCTNDHRVTVTT